MDHRAENDIDNRGDITNVILVGGTGSGKSQVGVHLARLLGFGFFDTDAEIEKRAGRSIHEIFERDGESAFRQLERDVIAFIATISSHVVVVGAGAVEDDDMWQALSQLGTLVWILSPSSEIAGRMMRKPDELAKRPLLADVVNIADLEKRRQVLIQRLDTLNERRIERYRTAAFSLVTGYSTPEAGAQQLKTSLLKSQQQVP